MTRQLIVIGKDNLNNSSLASYIEKHTTHSCCVVNVSEKTSIANHLIHSANLFLINYSSRNSGQIKTFLQKFSSLISGDSHIVLFNITTNNKIRSFSENSLIKDIFPKNISYKKIISQIKSIFDSKLRLSRKLKPQIFINTRKKQ